MEQQLYEQKDATLVYRSVLEAAEELDRDEALELLLSFIHLGLGDEVNLDECSKVVRLILKQNVASLIAADNRHKNAVENGLKGKDAGIKGKEHGSKGGRPRKGETKEEAYERRNPPKTPQETPVPPLNTTDENPPKTPLKEEEEVYAEVYEEKKEDVYEDKEKNNFLKNIVIKFINKYSNLDYSLNDEEFSSKYNYLMSSFQNFVKEQSGVELPIMFYSHQVIHYARTGRLDESQEKITYA